MESLAPWLRAPLRRTADALAAGRLAHALLVCGAQHIGKAAFTAQLAANLLCRERIEGMACGRCRDCSLYAAGAHPDLRRVVLEENDKTGVMRNDIVVEQIRDLGAWLALTAQRGGAQVAVIDPASAMNTSSANALLKTLEEPLAGRYLVLVCESPRTLSATIRSRCQRIVLDAPDRAQARAWLLARGHAASVADAALAAANGHPGLAAHGIEAGLLALRESVRKDLSALAAGRADPLSLASAWLADKQAEQRLTLAAGLAVDLLARGQGADFRPGWDLAGGDGERLAAWFARANHTRELLRSPIRGDLALAGLLRDWRAAVAA